MNGGRKRITLDGHAGGGASPLRAERGKELILLSGAPGDVQKRIEARAYELYRSRTQNGGTGDAVSDWLQAEREINGSTGECGAAMQIELKSQLRSDRLLATKED